MSDQTVNEALQNFLDRVRDSPHFSSAEINQVQKIKEVCETDLKLIEESCAKIQECRDILSAREQELDELLSQLSVDALKNPPIQALIRLFGEEHRKIERQIRAVEKELQDNYFRLGLQVASSQIQSSQTHNNPCTVEIIEDYAYEAETVDIPQPTNSSNNSFNMNPFNMTDEQMQKILEDTLSEI